MEERKMGRRESGAFKKPPRLSSKKREGGPKKETKLASSTMVSVDHESEGAGCVVEPH